MKSRSTKLCAFFLGCDGREPGNTTAVSRENETMNHYITSYLLTRAIWILDENSRGGSRWMTYTATFLYVLWWSSSSSSVYPSTHQWMRLVTQEDTTTCWKGTEKKKGTRWDVNTTRKSFFQLIKVTFSSYVGAFIQLSTILLLFEFKKSYEGNFDQSRTTNLIYNLECN